MHASRRALRLLFFLSVFAQAQEPTAPPLKDHTFHGPAYFENAKDSTDFMQFRNGLAAGRPCLDQRHHYVPMPHGMDRERTRRRNNDPSW